MVFMNPKKTNKIKYKAGPVLPTEPENDLLTPERIKGLLGEKEEPLSDAEMLAKELLRDAEKKGLSPSDIVQRNREVTSKIAADRRERKKAVSGRNIVITEAEANALFKKLSGEKKDTADSDTAVSAAPTAVSPDIEPHKAEIAEKNAPLKGKKKPNKETSAKKAQKAPALDSLGDTREISVPKTFRAPKVQKPSAARPVYEKLDLSLEAVSASAKSEPTTEQIKAAPQTAKKEKMPLLARLGFVGGKRADTSLPIASASASKSDAAEAPPAKRANPTNASDAGASVKKPAPIKEKKPLSDKQKTAIKTVFCSVCVALLFLPLALFSLTDASFYALYDGDKLSGFTFSLALIDAENAHGHFDARVEDEFSVSDMYSSLFPLRRFDVTRAFPVDITADNAVATVYVTRGMTVAEAIERSSFTYNEYDLITPAADTPLDEETDILIQRVTLSYRTVFEEMKSEQVAKPSPLLPDGETMVMNAGQAFSGSAYFDYVDRFLDGVYYDTEAVGVTVEDYPYNEITLVGDSTAAASPLDGSLYTDVKIIDNVPSSYVSMTANAPCTAYSFKPGVYGSSGMRLVQGMVAVDPDEYNYGDLLYITSADGSFVYGWAIAADACEAAMWGIVDIDCFFETYKESVLFGKRYLNVYVVDTLTKEQLEEYKEHEGMFNLRVPD